MADVDLIAERLLACRLKSRIASIAAIRLNRQSASHNQSPLPLRPIAQFSERRPGDRALFPRRPDDPCAAHDRQRVEAGTAQRRPGPAAVARVVGAGRADGNHDLSGAGRCGDVSNGGAEPAESLHHRPGEAAVRGDGGVVDRRALRLVVAADDDAAIAAGEGNREDARGRPGRNRRAGRASTCARRRRTG